MDSFSSLIANKEIEGNAKGILVGNKTDLNREVSTEEGMLAAEKIGGYFECSVVETPQIIDQIYQILVRRINSKEEKTIVELNGSGEQHLETEMKQFSLG